MWGLLFAAFVSQAYSPPVTVPPAPIAVSAPPPSPAQRRPPSVITNPDWLSRPPMQDMVKAYPPGALEKGVGGKTQIECRVDAQGRLFGCYVIKEDPPSMGFGAAALSLSDKFLMRPKTVDGTPVSGAKVIIPLNFAVAPDFDYTFANSLPDAERCLGYAFQQSPNPGDDKAFDTWTGWFMGDALRAGVTPDDASKRLNASTLAAEAALKTEKGVAEAAVCRKYYDSWKAQDDGEDD